MAADINPAPVDELATSCAVYRQDGAWVVTDLHPRDLSVEAIATAVRNLRAEEASFGLISIDDDFFIIVRPVPGEVKVLLSDATAALGEDADEVALGVLDYLDIDPEDLEDDIDLDDADPWAEGDLDIFADLGMPAQVLEALTSDPDSWADEQIEHLAEQLGFAEQLEEFYDEVDEA